MTTIEIELPEATAQAAQAAGLLTPQAMDRLLTDALERQQAAHAVHQHGWRSRHARCMMTASSGGVHR